MEFFAEGKYHPSHSQLRDEALLNEINKSIAAITDTTIDLKIGWLFNSIEDRMDAVKGDIPLPSSIPKSDQTVVFISFFRWIYGHVSGKKKYLHPYEWGKNHIYYMFHRLAEASKK